MASNFGDQYTELLIKQYFTKPKARAEIEMTVGAFEPAFGIVRDFPDAFDIDLAVGDQLDKIGKIVGVPRRVPLVIGKIAFGFVGNPKSRGFASKSDPLRVSAPFFRKFTPAYTDQELDDSDYRFIIKAKIAVNNTSAYMVSDDRISVQDVIQQAFDGKAYVIDKQNMTLWLYISPLIDLDRLRLLFVLKLLPKPQGVRYDYIVQAEPSGTFGFSSNENSKGFASKSDPSRESGILARKVLF